MQKLSFYLFILLVKLFSITPFWLVYRLSDVTFLLLYYVVGYRRKIAHTNLKKVFPEKSEAEINRFEKQYYHNLADLILESIKGYSLSYAELSKRFSIQNPETLAFIENNHHSIIIASAHCGNWEWGAMAAPIMTAHKTVGFYKPLSNKLIDNYVKTNRAANGMSLASIYETTKTFTQNKATRSAYFFISDQSPTNKRASLWIDFKGVKTAWLHGLEKHSRQNNLPVYYFGIVRVRRGIYNVFIEEITKDPNELPYGMVTAKYVEILERLVRERPDDWLWTHRRWKMQPPKDEIV